MIQKHGEKNSVGSLVRFFSCQFMDSKDDLWVPFLAQWQPYIPLAHNPILFYPTDRHCRNTYRVSLDIVSRNQRIPNSRQEQSGRIGLAGIYEKAPARVLSVPVFPFFTYHSSMVRIPCDTTSLDSRKLSVCFIAKMFRGSVESYYPNLSF